MLKSTIYLYRPAFTKTVIYMLQAVEYQPAVYLRWFWRVDSFNKVSYRKKLIPTRSARLLLAVLRIGMIAEYITGLILLKSGISSHSSTEIIYSLGVLFITPILWAHLVILPLILGKLFVIKPLHWLKIRRSTRVFAKHSGVKIAIAGSYGKTTMKEILLSILGEGKKVDATPANKNVGISHALFADKLKSDEDILIIEYGEGAPGDIAHFAKATQPDIGIITGLAPAHLDKYKTLERAGQDIFSLADYVDKDKLYVNGDSPDTKDFIKKNQTVYSAEGLKDWKTSALKQSIHGLNFSLSNGKQTIKIKSRLLGKHLAGSLALAAFLAYKLGLTIDQIESGITKIEPFEHRMRSYQLSGAWIIDDTYNGNIEGMKAGLELLKELPAKRKIYITPGLVDQGADEQKVHNQLGQAIAGANPDMVVLMKHSVTDAIVKGLEGYKGKLIIEADPLDFYLNLDKYVAAGDLVMMQNDWPDNYN